MQAKFETRKVVHTRSLGDIIRETRIEQGVRISDLAERTLIQPAFIELLEKGKYDQLPAQVYIEGYLQQIAKELRLSEKQLLKIYRKEIGIQENIRKNHARGKGKKRTYKRQRLFLSPTIIRNIVISVIVLLGIGYLWYQVSSLSQPPTLSVLQPEGDQEIDSDEIIVVGQVDKGAELTINGQSVYVSQTGDFKETLSLQDGSNTIEIRASNRLGRETVVTRQIYSTYEGASAIADGPVNPLSEEEVVANNGEDETEQEDEKKDEGVELTIEIIDLATWIQVEVDGDIEFSGTMLPGSTKTFKADEYISLTSGKAHKTIVTFNGEEIGALSSDGGVVRDLRFDNDLDVGDIQTDE